MILFVGWLLVNSLCMVKWPIPETNCKFYPWLNGWLEAETRFLLGRGKAYFQGVNSLLVSGRGLPGEIRSWYCGMIASEFPEVWHWIPLLFHPFFGEQKFVRTWNLLFTALKSLNNIIILRWFKWEFLLNNDGYFQPRRIGLVVVIVGIVMSTKIRPKKNSSDYQMKRNDCLMNTPCCKSMSLGDFLLQKQNLRFWHGNANGACSGYLGFCRKRVGHVLSGACQAEAEDGQLLINSVFLKAQQRCLIRNPMAKRIQSNMNFCGAKKSKVSLIDVFCYDVVHKIHFRNLFSHDDFYQATQR